MKETELRIGNYVTHDDYSSEVFTVETIEKESSHYYIHTKGGKNGYWDNNIQLINPIPLTEEWLVKFGWIYNKETKTFEKYPNGDARLHLHFVETNSSWTMFNFVLKALIANRIWYVHQLQNLYFALTGEEL